MAKHERQLETCEMSLDAETEAAYVSEAPEQETAWGAAPDGGWIDTIVCYQSSDTAELVLGYCDDDAEMNGQYELAFGPSFVIYPQRPLEGGYCVVAGGSIRRATKAEVKRWFGTRRTGF